MIEVYIDGASKGNPGLSGAGIYMKAYGEIYEYSLPLGMISNHEAEFQAVLKALEICKKLFPGEILSFRSDSRVVVDVIEKDFTKNQTFRPLLDRIKKETAAFPYFFIKWVPEKLNSHADHLAKKAIRMQ